MVAGRVLGHAYGGLPSMIALGSVVLGGVLERHPGLRVAFLEAGASWVPYVVDRMQESYDTFGLRGDGLELDPGAAVRGGQVYIAVEPEEPALPFVAELIGDDHLVLGSDYCHPEGMCPFTMQALAERDDLSEATRRKILHENPARLYGLG